MNFIHNYDIFLRIFLSINIFLGINQHVHTWGERLLMLVILIILNVNDLLRRFGFLQKKILVSMGVSLLAVTILSYYITTSNIYFGILIWDFIFIFKWPYSLWYVSLTSIIYFTVWTMTHTGIQFTWSYLREGNYLMFPFLPLFSIIIIGYLYQYQIQKRVQVQKLNHQLQEANEKLIKYAAEIRVLTVTKERNRLAQQIHDSLGHSMAGLIMHLDFIEKLIDQDPEKGKELIRKAQRLARQGMEEVRFAVQALNSNEGSGALKKSLDQLIDNLQTESGLRISLDFPPDLEKLPPHLKSVIYKNIQEAITNSLKHGGAKIIHISLSSISGEVKCIVEDDGKGCLHLKKGNGLLGMEERLLPFAGKLDWYSGAEGGFTLIFKLPIKEEVENSEEDQSIDCG